MNGAKKLKMRKKGNVMRKKEKNRMGDLFGRRREREKHKEGEKITAADTLFSLGLTMQGSVPEQITDSLCILIY